MIALIEDMGREPAHKLVVSARVVATRCAYLFRALRVAKRREAGNGKSDDEFTDHLFISFDAQRTGSAVEVALCVNPQQHRVRKGLPIMEQKAGTASTDEKEALRIAILMKQNAIITTR